MICMIVLIAGLFPYVLFPMEDPTKSTPPPIVSAVAVRDLNHTLLNEEESEAQDTSGKEVAEIEEIPANSYSFSVKREDIPFGILWHSPVLRAQAEVDCQDSRFEWVNFPYSETITRDFLNFFNDNEFKFPYIWWSNSHRFQICYYVHIAHFLGLEDFMNRMIRSIIEANILDQERYFVGKLMNLPEDIKDTLYEQLLVDMPRNPKRFHSLEEINTKSYSNNDCYVLEKNRMEWGKVQLVLSKIDDKYEHNKAGEITKNREIKQKKKLDIGYKYPSCFAVNSNGNLIVYTDGDSTNPKLYIYDKTFDITFAHPLKKSLNTLIFLGGSEDCVGLHVNTRSTEASLVRLALGRKGKVKSEQHAAIDVGKEGVPVCLLSLGKNRFAVVTRKEEVKKENVRCSLLHFCKWKKGAQPSRRAVRSMNGNIIGWSVSKDSYYPRNDAVVIKLQVAESSYTGKGNKEIAFEVTEECIKRDEEIDFASQFVLHQLLKQAYKRIFDYSNLNNRNLLERLPLSLQRRFIKYIPPKTKTNPELAAWVSQKMKKVEKQLRPTEEAFINPYYVPSFLWLSSLESTE